MAAKIGERLTADFVARHKRGLARAISTVEALLEVFGQSLAEAA